MVESTKQINTEIINNHFKKIHERLDRQDKKRDTAFFVIGLLIFFLS